MFQCNEHVEVNKFLCILACTWMTIIDTQFYIIDSLSLDVSLGLNAYLVVAWLYVSVTRQRNDNDSHRYSGCLLAHQNAQSC